jgi:hypothetical protein
MTDGERPAVDVQAIGLDAPPSLLGVVRPGVLASNGTQKK